MRPEKKQTRRRRIAQAAHHLFAKHGYNNTTMEMIADSSDVAVGTLYNYATSKADLLINIIASRSNEYNNDLVTLANNPPKQFHKALKQAIAIYLTSFSFFNKSIWRDFTITALVNGLPLFQMIENIDAIFLSQITLLIKYYHPQNLTQHTATIMTRNLYSALLHNIMLYLSIAEMNFDSLRSTIMKQIETMFIFK
ncbi:MAG: TetR/AcrR family transcriptional regulator [Deltaproteobacteria bacterium]|nr:TetR/AcrR family transcriptional regulator [Deltaproteobacteria bacterium]